MKVIFNGEIKDLHYSIASKLLKSGKAKLIESYEEIKQPKQRKKVV